MSARTQFDHEKLHVYQLQLDVIAWISDLLAELQGAKRPRLGEVIDQLDRASLSTLLNLAEGNGRRASQQRVRFFDDARGSATECAACLDALVAKKACEARRVVEGKSKLLSVVSILSALIERFGGNSIATEMKAQRKSGDSQEINSTACGGGVRV
jgi:four helix bundle protein